MEELFAVKDFFRLFEGSMQIYTMVGIMLIALYPLLFVARKLIGVVLYRVISSKAVTYTEIVKRHKLHTYMGHVVFCAYLVFWSRLFEQAGIFSQFMLHIKSLFLTVYATIVIAAFIISIINISVDIYGTREVSNRVPISLHAHILKIIITICAVLLVISKALNVDMSALFTSLGAAAALLTFVFKDTVLGLLASLQLTFQDIIKVGDWITVPQYGADGVVENITITVVKVRNFDKTMSTLPTYALISGGVKNWQAMKDLGGRRIKRHVSLNMDTIRFCDQEMLDKLIQIPYCATIAKKQPELFKEENRVTNLTILRHYIREYIDNHEMIYKEGFMCIVRQLQSTSVGVPLEVYVFTKEVDWTIYESIQADIFDHIYGIIPAFGLRIFQYVESTPDSLER